MNEESLAPVIVRTHRGQGLHLPQCPHVRGCEVHVAFKEELEAIPVCDWSQAELDGVGRRYFASLEEAMRYFGTHAGTERLIRRHVAQLLFDQIWVPHSRGYIAFGLNGVGVAWVGKTCVEFFGGRLEALPGYSPGGARRWPDEKRYGRSCPTCWQSLPLTGVCDGCE